MFGFFHRRWRLCAETVAAALLMLELAAAAASSPSLPRRGDWMAAAVGVVAAVPPPPLERRRRGCLSPRAVAEAAEGGAGARDGFAADGVRTRIAAAAIDRFLMGLPLLNSSSPVVVSFLRSSKFDSRRKLELLPSVVLPLMSAAAPKSTRGSSLVP